MDGLLNGRRYGKAAVGIAAHDVIGKVTGLRLTSSADSSGVIEA